MGRIIQDGTIHAHLNRRLLHSRRTNAVEWINLYNHNDATQIPRQKEVNPYCREDDAKQRARVDKSKTYELRDQGRPDKPKLARSDPHHGPKGKPDRRQPPAAQPPAQQAPKLVTPTNICIRNLFHQAAPTQFQPCSQDQCPRNHTPPLVNGKLSAADKAAVRANLENNMKGKFPAPALKQLDTLL